MSQTIQSLYQTILSRKTDPTPGSYTAKLFTAGDIEISKKLGEEAIEVIIASYQESDERLASESADLIYHLLVLLASRDVPWTAVESELDRRKAPLGPPIA